MFELVLERGKEKGSVSSAESSLLPVAFEASVIETLLALLPELE